MNVIPRSLLLVTRYLLLILSLAACTKQEPIYQEQLLALGTLVNITFWDVDNELSQQASAQLAEDFDHLYTTWHAWQPSDLTRINERLASGTAFTVDPALLPLMTRARELSLAGDSLFNPAIGKLIGIWGFHSDEPQGPPPSLETIAALVAQHPSMADLHIEGNTLQSSNSTLQLDFGAIGKGYAADLAIAHLRKLGIHNAIVAVSGDIHVIGKRGKRPWRIGIRNPRGAGIIASVEMHEDEGISTSGDYERYFEYQGKRYHHLIDPRSGYPASGTISVTVLHADSTTADAASTALFVAGPKNWERVARAMGVQQIMLIDSTGTVHLTPALAARIRFEIKPAPKVEISNPL